MLANFFGKSNPITLVVILSVFLSYFFAHEFLTSGTGFIAVFQIQEMLVNTALLLLLFFFFNFILTKNKLTLINSYGFLFFIILFGFFPQGFLNIHQLLVTIVLFILVRKLLSLRNSTQVIQKTFDAGFWFAILFLLDSFTIVYLLIVLTAIHVFQKITLPVILIFLVGFLAPILIYFGYCFWFDLQEQFTTHFFLYTTFDFSVYNNLKTLIPLGIVLLVLLVSIIVKTPMVISISGKFRKYWTVVLLYLIAAITYVLFVDVKNGSELLHLFFPAAVIITNWIESIKKKWFKEAVLIIFLLLPFLLFII